MMKKNIKIRKKIRSFSRHKGFTLIELLMVIVIVVIMAAVVLANLLGTKSGTNLSVAQREVAAAIRTAQAYSLQGKTFLLNSGETATPTSFFFDFSNNNTYRIRCTSCQDTIETHNLPAGITLDSPDHSLTRITFLVPHGNMTLNNGETLDLILKDRGSSSTKKISATVSADGQTGGLISEQ